MTVATRARQRAAALREVDRPGMESAHALLVTHLDGLVLPPVVAQVAPYLPAGGLLVVAAAITVAGLAGVAGLGLVAAVVDVTLRRSAPRRRAAASERALPSVLDAVARQLRAGGSLAQAIAAGVPPATAPDLQRSWSRLTRLIPLVGVVAALDDWASTNGAKPHGGRRSTQLAAAALALAATTGGSPARAIDGVAATLRSRLAVADEIRALSSQARASAFVIALAPVVFGVVAGASDHRTRDFLASPAGLALVALGVALDVVGAWWMAKLCGSPATPA